MFFWNSLAFLMIQRMLAIWSLVPLPFLKSLNIWKFTVHVLLKPGLENFRHHFTSVSDECNCAVVWAFFGTAFLWDWNEKNIFNLFLLIATLMAAFRLAQIPPLFKNKQTNTEMCHILVISLVLSALSQTPFLILVFPSLNPATWL